MNATATVATNEGEKQRNRLLRRADWRFLLPDFHPGKAICFAAGSLADAARCVSDSVAQASGYQNTGFDLAVALDPGPEAIEKAFASLNPGGTFYAEWRSRPNRDVDSIRRRLARAGFGNVSLYWPRPDPEVEPATIWLPLESPEVLRYYLDHRPLARNLARTLARAVRRIAFLPRPRFRFASPVSSVARRPASNPITPGLLHQPAALEMSHREASSKILNMIRDGWTRWGVGATTPEHLSMMLVTRGQRASGKAVALVFAAGDDNPVLAVKMPRVPESVAFLRREVSILHALGDHALIRDSVPRVLAAGEAPAGYVVVETALRGLPAFVVLNRQNFRQVAIKATEWLERLAGRPEPRPRSEWWPRLVEPLLSEFQEHFGSVIEPDLLHECRRILDSLGSLPLVWEQRDFSPWNVFVDREGEIAAVDWESAEQEGLPLLDLVYFLTYLSFSLDRARQTGRFTDSYRALLDPLSFTGSIARECMDRYAIAIGLDETQYRPLRLLTWILHARSEYLHLVGDAGRPPSQDALRRALFVGLWREEVRPCHPA